jgi:hypothetical protein
MRPKLARVASLAFLAVATSACTKTLDTKGLEPTLAGQFDEQFGTTGTTVSCPTGIKAETGGTFDCTATLSDGSTVTLHITQKNADGEVQWKSVGASTPTPSP